MADNTHQRCLSIERIVKMESRANSNSIRIDNIEKHTEAIIKMGSSLEHLAKSVAELAGDVASMKSVPANKWNELMKASLIVMLTLVATYIFNNIIL